MKKNSIKYDVLRKLDKEGKLEKPLDEHFSAL